MLTIIYCPACLIVIGVKAYLPASHVNEGDTHECLLIEAEEPEYTGQTAFLTTDNTEISSYESWLTYLAKYIP